MALLAFCANAQKNVTLNITHKLGANNFAFTQAGKNDLNHDFKITRVDYYLSGFTIIHDGGMQMVVPVGKYILAKGNGNVSASLGSFNVTNVEGIKFHVGVEAPNNNADPTQWLAPHPLAPQSPSMHWGWTSGFRFIALEGNAGATFNTTFEMHGLGNANYFEQTVMANGVNTGTNVAINLDADYNQALKGININAGPIDHGVNATDLTVLQNFRDRVFKASVNAPASINDALSNLGVTIYPNPSSGNIILEINNTDKNVTTANVIDVTGKIMQSINVAGKKISNITIGSKGLYFVQLVNEQTVLASQPIIIN